MSVDSSLASKSVDSSLVSKTVDSSLTSKSVDLSLASKIVDGRLPLKTNMDISNTNSEHKMALKVDCAEAGYGQNKVTDIKWNFCFPRDR